MNERSNLSDHVDDRAAFAAAISTATGRVKNFSSRLAALSNISITPALKIPTLSSTAAQMIAPSHILTTQYQCKPMTSPQTKGETWTYLGAADNAFVIGTVLLRGAKLWADAMKWLRLMAVAPIVKTGASIAGRIAGPFARAIAESQKLAAISAAAGELVAAVVVLAASTPLAAIGAAALFGGAVYVAWRKRGDITRAVPRLDAAISHGATKLWSELVATVSGGPKDDGDIASTPGEDSALRRSGRSRLRSIPPLMLHSVSADLAALQPLVFSPLRYAGFSPLSLGAEALRAAAVMMLTAPLLGAPAQAAVAVRGISAETASFNSIVINSTPTIIINSNQPDEIEQRVLAALKQHREAIYAQWCSELQRRQRTEF